MIEDAPMLYNTNFNKDFLLYTFGSDTSLTIVATHKDELNNEHAISFMSLSMEGPKLNYPTMDKQAYIVYKAVKHFRPYLPKNHFIVFVPHPAIKSLLVQQDLGEIHVKWMTRLQEYGCDIKPVDTIKGDNLYKLTAEEVHEQAEEEKVIRWEKQINMYNVEQAPPTSHENAWYKEVCQYLQHDTMPSQFSMHKRREL